MSELYQANRNTYTLAQIEEIAFKAIKRGLYATCDDCDAVTTITIEPYGTSKMATIECPNCGTSYDTNLDEEDGK